MERAMRIAEFRIFFSLLVLISSCAMGQLFDVQISASPRKLDEQRGRQQGNLTITTKEIAYKVTVENRTFKTMPELLLKYMIFYVDPKPGTDQKPIEAFHTGSEMLHDLASNRATTFETTPIKLIKEELDPGWYWVGSGKSRSKDRVTGVWIRAYSNDKLVGEYSNPTSISKTREWKE
jgi:hypothetical protein